MRQLVFLYCVLACCIALLVSGCGRSDSQQAGGERASVADELGDISDKTNDADKAHGELTASISSHGELAQDAAPDKGSPEWLIREIKILLSRPLEPIGEDLSPQETEAARRVRNQEIVDLATEAIAKSHADPEKEATFNEAVRLLMEARLQLALAGSRRDMEALYEDAASLSQRAPKSKAAAEAAFVLARFAQMNAGRYAANEPRWLEEYARQARLFAENFPHETTRAVALLYSAGWSCELHRLIDEAIGCYSLLLDKYPDSPQSQQVTAVIRRLTLEGKPLELAGPTLDGGYLSIDDYAGQVVLVVFWATGTTNFADHLPQLNDAARKFKESGFAVIGVSLDEEQDVLKSFVAEKSVDWPQIFHFDEANRRWNHPIARYYGVRDIPAYWLVDQQGIVVDIFVDPGELDENVAALLKRGQ